MALFLMDDRLLDTGRASSASIDFFISRRGASAAVAREVAEVLMEAGHSVLVQDLDFAPGTNFVAVIHDALKKCRHMVLLLTKDYDASDFTVMEMTNFLAAAVRDRTERRLVVLRVEECNPDGILAGIVFSDLVGVEDPQERRERILAAAEGRVAPASRRTKIFENVPPRDLNFTGRDARLGELHRLLREGDQQTAVTQAAICGLGGIGKTSLAVEYAHRYGNSYAGVWWAPAEQRTLLVASLASLAARLEPRLAEEANQENAARAALARLSRSTMPFLLIYDNVETPETLRDLLPSTGARVLLTTRWADWGGQAAEIKLDVLDRDAAAAFLQKRAGRTDAAGAARLAAALGALPVALDHAGAYCRLTAASFDSYREKIDVRISRAPKGAAYPASVAASFGLAIEKAAADQPLADLLLGLFAFLAPERIPLDLLADEIAAKEDRAEALGELGAVSLIEHDAFDDGAPAVTLHRLVQAAMRARVTQRGQTAAVVELATRALASAFRPMLAAIRSCGRAAPPSCRMSWRSTSCCPPMRRPRPHAAIFSDGSADTCSAAPYTGKPSRSCARPLRSARRYSAVSIRWWECGSTISGCSIGRRDATPRRSRATGRQSPSARKQWGAIIPMWRRG
jgi:hypothetical protein